jgi:16S rRNA (uracil1498-N3)-methyltransferase
MALHQLCVNDGGQSSLVKLDIIPLLDEETPLSVDAQKALGIWQARVGEIVTVVDSQMTSYRARLTCLDEEGASCIPFQRLEAPVESPLHIEVYQSLPDKERFEIVLQKLTELGVNRIVPIESKRSATLEERDAGQKKSHRWPAVVNKASRQCRRAVLPELFDVQTFSEALSCAASAELKLMLYEGDAPWSLTEGFGSLKPQSVALMVGPEGGFSHEQVVQAQAEGFLPVSLGPRILRTETAAIVAAALVQSYLGDLG